MQRTLDSLSCIGVFLGLPGAPHIGEILFLLLHKLSDQYLSSDREPCPKAIRRLHWPKIFITKSNFPMGGGS